MLIDEVVHKKFDNKISLSWANLSNKNRKPKNGPHFPTPFFSLIPSWSYVCRTLKLETFFLQNSFLLIFERLFFSFQWIYSSTSEIVWKTILFKTIIWIENTAYLTSMLTIDIKCSCNSFEIFNGIGAVAWKYSKI